MVEERSLELTKPHCGVPANNATCVASSFFGGKSAKALSISRKIAKFFGVRICICGAVVCIILHRCLSEILVS